MDSRQSETEDVFVPEPGCSLERKPGALRGQILMAEDFDIFPDDFLDAMGA